MGRNRIERNGIFSTRDHIYIYVCFLSVDVCVVFLYVRFLERWILWRNGKNRKWMAPKMNSLFLPPTPFALPREFWDKIGGKWDAVFFLLLETNCCQTGDRHFYRMKKGGEIAWRALCTCVRLFWGGWRLQIFFSLRIRTLKIELVGGNPYHGSTAYQFSFLRKAYFLFLCLL